MKQNITNKIGIAPLVGDGRTFRNFMKKVQVVKNDQ